MVVPDDAALLEAVRNGDQRAWRALIERYQGAVAGVVVGMLGPGDEADDVGQETFIRCFRAIDRFRGDASLSTWLHRIAVNLSLNALRRRQRGWRRFVPIDDESADTEPLAWDPRVEHDANATADVVRQAVQRLPAAQRAVVMLRLLEGYSTRDTAAMLAIAEGTVMSRLARASATLRQLLGPLIDDREGGPA